jgi:hypothetical protein
LIFVLTLIFAVYHIFIFLTTGVTGAVINLILLILVASAFRYFFFPKPQDSADEETTSIS